ncbi:MAG: hypothetical protein R3E54_15675 [Halioglobus sp.]
MLVLIGRGASGQGYEVVSEDPAAPPGFVVDVALETEVEFLALLRRAEQLIDEGALVNSGQARVTFVLHGPVLHSLTKGSYPQNKPLVDLAASLSALQVIDVKACRSWMGSHGIDDAELLPFVETVAYGPGLVQQLVEQRKYVYF